MGLFKNGVGRPSNETLKKRRIVFLAIVFVAVIGIGASVFYTVNYFKNRNTGTVGGTEKNATSSQKYKSQVYKSISVANNSGILYDDSTRVDKKVSRKLSEDALDGNTPLRIELPSVDNKITEANLTISVSFGDDMVKGKKTLGKTYYYAMKISMLNENEIQTSSTGKISIQNKTVSRTVRIGSNVAYIYIEFYDATKKAGRIETAIMNVRQLPNLWKVFPDKNLRECTLDNINHYCSGDGKKTDYCRNAPFYDITDSQLSRLVGGFSCKNKGITDPTGLEKLSNLEGLDLENNKLTKLNLSKNTRLKYLKVSDNELTNITFPVSGLDLIYVNLNSNHLSSLTINPRNLQELYLGHNAISKVTFKSDPTKLKKLELESNSLNKNSISLTKMTSLEYLTMDNNKNLSEVNLTKNVNLQEAYFAKCALKKINVKNNKKLTVLVLDSNQLESLDLRNNTKLKSLSVSGNKNLKKSNIKVAKNVDLNKILYK